MFPCLKSAELFLIYLAPPTFFSPSFCAFPGAISRGAARETETVCPAHVPEVEAYSGVISQL